MKASTPVRYADFVWQRLRKIPPGQTLPYGEVAASIGRPGGARAVDGACRANPLMLLVPCHRVIGAGGKLTGFASAIYRDKIAVPNRHGNRLSQGNRLLGISAD